MASPSVFDRERENRIRLRVYAALCERGFVPADPLRGSDSQSTGPGEQDIPPGSDPCPHARAAGIQEKDANTLLAEYVDGSEAAFRKLYDKHKDAVSRRAARHLANGSLDDVEEAVQAAWIAFFENAPMLVSNNHSNVVAHLFQILKNKCIGMLRNKAIFVDFNEEAPVSDDDPFVNVLFRESRKLAMAYLAANTDALQEEIVDLWLQGYVDAEIAERIRLTECHIRVIRHRTLKKIREHIDASSTNGDRRMGFHVTQTDF